MKLVLSQSAYVLLASSSVTIAAWRLMQWRARKRAKLAAERVQGMVKPGPLVSGGCCFGNGTSIFCFADLIPHVLQINAKDKVVCENMVNSAIRRASKWISFQLSAEDGSVMIGQVGGVSMHKRPLLTLEPDYVMKPVQTDHRGMREIFLYESVKVLHKSRNSHPYASMLTGTSSKSHIQPLQQNGNQSSDLQLVQASGLTEMWDTLAMWLAMKTNDPVVAEYERLINKSWKALKKEVDTLRRLATFIPSYYGVVGQRSPMSMPKGEEEAHKAANNMNGDENALNNSHFGMSLEAHLLLTDVTANFSKPCVMDIKMGSQTYEPDAPEEKRLREIAKYPLQETFGFRIVGMRFFDPFHPEADENGFRFFRKEYGRTLRTVEDLADALRLFVCATSRCSKNEEAVGSDSDKTNGISKINNMSNGGDDKQLSEEGRLRIRVLSNFLAQLRPIMGFFDENKTLGFYSSSLLLVYEGDRSASNADVTSIKMIDFGRVRRQPGGDQGYRLGLRTLKTVMDRVRKEEKARFS